MMNKQSITKHPIGFSLEDLRAALVRELGIKTVQRISRLADDAIVLSDTEIDAELGISDGAKER